MYVIRIGHSDFICKGTYIVEGEIYQIVGNSKEAIKFKSRQSAINYAERIRLKRANMWCSYEIVDLKE